MQSDPEPHDPGDGPAAAWFLRLRDGLWRLFPGPLRRRVPPTLVGYCILNGSTFALDLALLALLYRVIGLPNPVALTIAYGTALTLAYLLNRWFNFRSHGSVGRQSARYVAVVVVNYTVFLLGVGSGLTHLGVHYQLARLAAGLCEAVWMYCALRWIVFPDAPGDRVPPRTRG